MTDYHRLPIAQKRAQAIATMREPAVTCPACETQTTARDLLEHLATRCPGRRDPHPASEWITWSRALELGVPGWTLTRWVQSGEVRTKGGRMDRLYLLRDVATRLAHKRASRRR